MDGAFRTAAKPMRRLAFAFVRSIDSHLSRFAAPLPPGDPACPFLHASRGTASGRAPGTGMTAAGDADGGACGQPARHRSRLTTINRVNDPEEYTEHLAQIIHEGARCRASARGSIPALTPRCRLNPADREDDDVGE